MDAGDRARTYAAFADATRRWVSVMDTKAGFLFAVNGALLTFMWIGARLADVNVVAHWLALGASLCSLLALLAALWIVVPRASIVPVDRRSADHRAVSFYGYVASHYAEGDFARFERDIGGFDDADFGREALAEHFVVSRIVQSKAAWVTVSGTLTFASMAMAGIALLVKTLLG
jgi:hypothetical protein